MVNPSQRFARLVDRIARLSPFQLDEVERLVAKFESLPARRAEEKESGDMLPHSKDWPHAPLHRLSGKGTYIVTAGTLNKEHFFGKAELVDLLESQLLGKAHMYHWQLVSVHGPVLVF